MAQQQQQRSTGTAVAKVAPRLPYPVDLKDSGFDEGRWRVLTDAVFPSAKTVEAVRMAIDYCKARNLDVMKKPVHIVPMYSTVLKRMVETVWPSVTEIRITASRTGEYAGCDEAVFGEEATETFAGTFTDDAGNRDTKKITVTFPSWCRVTVYRMVRGQRIPFPGPRVLWKEAYGRQGKTELPNEMWQKRPYGQLEKCAEVAALRKAFPEEIGSEYAAEEMEGREIEAGKWAAVPAEAPPPPRPTREQFNAPPAPEPVDAEIVSERPANGDETPQQQVDPPKPPTMKPVHVPMTDLGDPDWPKWQSAILAAVLRCPNADTLREWWGAQLGAFDNFAMEFPEKAGAMQETVDLRLKELEPPTAEAA